MTWNFIIRQPVSSIFIAAVDWHLHVLLYSPLFSPRNPLSNLSFSLWSSVPSSPLLLTAFDHHLDLKIWQVMLAKPSWFSGLIKIDCLSFHGRHKYQTASTEIIALYRNNSFLTDCGVRTLAGGRVGLWLCGGPCSDGGDGWTRIKNIDRLLCM